MSAEQASAAEGSLIAVIGMAGRFPGAKSVDELWANVRDGVESIRFFTDEELLAAGESPELLRDPAYVKAWPQLEGIDLFDATFFGLSPRDAAVFDPQHRLFLEAAWEAFENAGYVGEACPGPVGVFAACGMSEYMIKNLVTNPEVMDSVGEWLVRHLGNDTNFLATRVSYQLNLRGPSMNVQTACSSSLVAIHLASQSLLNGECDMALAGGSTVSPEQNRGYLYKVGEILSPDGHCRAFDAKSQGTTIGSATGCVVLKRYDDAVADGDTILAVIRGSAVNNDGSQKVGYLAPSVEGQARVVAEALAVSGVSADEVSYVETHGTGTLIGDPIEIAGLTQAFRATTERKQFCAIGSLKPNVGHAGEAAGISSFIKTVQALRHRQLPPSLFYEEPNPQAFFAESPFFVNAKLTEWKSRGPAPRRAGVTGLGAGGTNAHVIVEEAPVPRPSAPSGRAHQVLVLSAKTASALEQATKNLAAYLRANPAVPLADVAYTLQVGRTPFAHRRAVVAKDAAEAIAALESVDPKRVATQLTKRDGAGVVFMFPGGGAQYARMGRDLYASEPLYRQTLDACAAVVNPRLGLDLRTLLYPPATATPAEVEAATKRLEKPAVALPALFATEYALAKLLLSWNVTPAAMIGHSAGEYVAACLAGVITFQEGLELVALRGKLFETLPPGAMLSVSLSEAEARAYMGPELSFAAINAPGLCVASGPARALDAMEARLREADVEHTRVHIDVAAHSSMLEPILAEFERFCRTLRFKAPSIPYVSNLTGTWITEAEVKDPAYWVKHLRHTVRFADGMAVLLADPSRVFVEIGPGRTLSSLARQQPIKAPQVTSTVRHPKEEGSDVAFLLSTLGRIWLAGAAVDWARVHGGPDAKRRRVPLPTYPFERQRYWIEPGKGATVVKARPAGATALTKRGDVSSWFYAPTWRRAPLVADGAKAGAEARWLVLADASGFGERLASRLPGSVTVVTAGRRYARSGSGKYTVRPGESADYEALVAELLASGELPDRVVHTWGVTAPPAGWTKLVPATFAPGGPLVSFASDLELHYFSQLFLAQALGREVEALEWTVVSTDLQQVAGESDLLPEKATLLGPCRVIPREWPHMASRSIDVPRVEAGAWQEGPLLDRLARELLTKPDGETVAYRGVDRWTQIVEPLALDAAPATPRARTWLRSGAVVIITGGLGGIGLAVAEHLAREARARLVLVGRRALPARATWDAWLAAHAEGDATSTKILKIRAIEALGSEVLVESADVADHDAMHDLVGRVRARFGAVHGVVHSAGALNDALIATRPKEARSEVIETKVKGALVLDSLFPGSGKGAASLDFFVLFSSVSSLLGLPGQVDYTAANAFLDAFAHARAARAAGRTVVVNWNAWNEVGMAVDLVRAAEREPDRDRARAGHHPLLERALIDTEAETLFATTLRRGTTGGAPDGGQWVIDEHVVRGAEAVIPGTGFLELGRAALAHRPEARPIEIRDVVFLAPFVVPAFEPRELRVRVTRGAEASITVFGDDETQPNVTMHAAYVDTPRPPPVDVGALIRRVIVRVVEVGGFAAQSFMDFGPRWGNVRRMHFGAGEAVAEIELPASFTFDLAAYALHPALLDTATGGAQELIPGFDGARDFYVPFSYGKVTVFAPLTPKLVSHVRHRHRDAATKGTAQFDVTICDERGQVLVEVREFTMRQITDRARLAGQEARARGAKARADGEKARPETALVAALREGILPAEGIVALDRILSGEEAQVIASSVDFLAWEQVVSADARATAARDHGKGDGAAAGKDGGPQFVRPNLSTAYEAPRTEVERDVADMWRDLLGVADVGIHDDFFELGGQSLIAVRLFNKIRKKLGVELPLTTLFEAPTIAGCAAILQAALGIAPRALEGAPPNGGGTSGPAHAAPPAPPAAPVRRLLHAVTIQRGGERAPFFVVHGAGGNVLNFRDMARLLDRQQPFYGLQARGVDGVLRPHTTIEEMATAYLDDVRVVQPRGPYLLGGYSGGGLVAFEMAQRLTAAGETVALLALIDTYYPEMRQRGRDLASRWERLQRDGTRATLLRTYATQKRRALHASLAARLELCLRRDEQVPFELRNYHLTVRFEAAAARYRARAWPGRATLFRAEQLFDMFETAAPDYGWSDVVRGGVDVVTVPGDHDTLLLGANAEVMLGRLRDAIDVAQRACAEGWKETGAPSPSARDRAGSAIGA
jgi:acyl transferase domain-containing protein/thioesterase domain-containing protein/acyl carrier protein